jgi:hypothetical protein
MKLPTDVEVFVSPDLREALAKAACTPDALLDAERLSITGSAAPSSALWEEFADAVRSAYAVNDWVVVRGLPVDGDGVALLWALGVISRGLRVYRGDKVLKHFRMSPWTRALSHTLAAGEFHTDLNTAESPPATTGILCLEPDPGAPTYGAVRAARLPDLLEELRSRGHADCLRFLLETEVSMVNDASPRAWTGRIVDGATLRFHPETIRAANVRRGAEREEFASELDRIQEAAMNVSVPISLDRGDALLVSNTRALHYRGACTVAFTRFPTEFESRRIGVAHGVDEA